MNKKYLYILITIFLVIIFYFKESITQNILYTFNTTKQTISNYIMDTKESINLHFNQIEQIKQLTKENQEYKDYIQKVIPQMINCEKLSLFKKIKNPNVIFTQTISYANLPDLTSIYINYHEKNLTTPRGLIYNNQVAGIVIKSYDNFSLAYLNTNPKTSYTVFIGDKKIPGVLFGGDKLIVKYIPKYHKINIGDLVITSGLDKIFYEGVNVGKVESITQTELFQEVSVVPFYDPLHPTFFYVIKF